MTARSLVGGSNVIKGSGYRPDAAAMFLELAKFASLLLSILSLDAVFHAAFLTPAHPYDQRLEPGFEALLLSAAICLGSGFIFRAWEARYGRRDVQVAATLPM